MSSVISIRESQSSALISLFHARVPGPVPTMNHQRPVAEDDIDEKALWSVRPSSRSRAREAALQVLYQLDFDPDADPHGLRATIDQRVNGAKLRRFAWSLIMGTRQHRDELDARISAVATNWKLSRMAASDRAALRLGAYELLHTDTPPSVILDEIINVARLFGGEQSPQFVNGVLDKLIQRSDSGAPDEPSGESVNEPGMQPTIDDASDESTT